MFSWSCSYSQSNSGHVNIWDVWNIYILHKKNAFTTIYPSCVGTWNWLIWRESGSWSPLLWVRLVACQKRCVATVDFFPGLINTFLIKSHNTLHTCYSVWQIVQKTGSLWTKSPAVYDKLSPLPSTLSRNCMALFVFSIAQVHSHVYPQRHVHWRTPPPQHTHTLYTYTPMWKPVPHSVM